MIGTLGEFDHVDDLSGVWVAVYGLGKMGLPLAAVLADHGADVLGVDIDPEVVETVNEGSSPTDEPGVSDLLDAYVGERLQATTEGAEAAEESDVMIVLVPTVLDEDGEPALDPLLAAGADIAEGVSNGDLVITESSVPPGTTEGPFLDTLERSGLRAGEDFGLAHCPERTYSGRVVRDLTESYPKVVGGIDPESTSAAAGFYSTFNEPGVIELPSATAAEAVKVFEGAYRDVNIALANELAKACEEWRLDASVVFDAANSQPYCNIHDPGIGVGGHCIPVYPWFVIGRASDTPLEEVARRINDDMPTHAIDLLERMLEEQGSTLEGARVLVLGLAYRPGVPEIRYAPGVDVVQLLAERGAVPFAHDPLITDEEIADLGARPGHPATVEELDGIVLATGHEEYRSLDMTAIRERMATPALVDGRDFFDRDALAGFNAVTIGDGTSDLFQSEARGTET